MTEEGAWAPTRLPARAMMADIFDRPPEFTDLTVADEWTG